MSEEKAPYGQVPNFAGGHATWKREQNEIIKALAEHGVTIEHESHLEKVLPTDVTGQFDKVADNFAGESHYYNWKIDKPALAGVSYSFPEALGDIIDALKEKAGK